LHGQKRATTRGRIGCESMEKQSTTREVGENEQRANGLGVCAPLQPLVLVPIGHGHRVPALHQRHLTLSHHAHESLIRQAALLQRRAQDTLA
jgi:hypothetical protein